MVNHSNVLNFTTAHAQKEAERRARVARRFVCLQAAIHRTIEAERGELSEEMILAALTVVTQERARNDLDKRTRGRRVVSG